MQTTQTLDQLTRTYDTHHAPILHCADAELPACCRCAVYAPFLSTHDCRPNSFATRRMKGSEIFMSLCSWARVYSTAAALALRLYLSLRRDLFAAFINFCASAASTSESAAASVAPSHCTHLANSRKSDLRRDEDLAPVRSCRADRGCAPIGRKLLPSPFSCGTSILVHSCTACRTCRLPPKDHAFAGAAPRQSAPTTSLRWRHLIFALNDFLTINL